MASPSTDLDMIYSVIEKEFNMFTEHEKKHLFDPEKLTDDGRTYAFLAPLSETSYDTSTPSTFALDIFPQTDDIPVTTTSHFDVPDQFTTVATLNSPPETTDAVQGQLTHSNAEVVNVMQGRNGHILSLDHAPSSEEGLMMVTHDIVDESEKMDIMFPVSPKEVFGEDAPKKRGRKRKSDGSQTPSSSSRRRPKKPKAYEREIPFEDEEQERKRKNAMNAKRHRDQQKKNMQDLRDQLKSVTEERDALKKELERLRLQEQTAMQQLLVYQQGQTTSFPLLVIEQQQQPHQP
ncbi:uncharacterized protein [Panulirus ornatus]|uniref:uncharacterized protein n=1 Tax=Panulirus ornatus TaxID=150431 RepID=UPI003A86C9DD